MDYLKESRIMLDAIEIYGAESQKKMVLEEMSELQKEICKSWRGKQNAEQIAEEVADVEIMLAQLKIIYGIYGTVEDYKEMKLERLEKNVQEEKENQKKAGSRKKKGQTK